MEDLAQRPAGDVLEEIVRRGPAGYPAFVACYPAAAVSVRVAILVGGLVLGPDAAEACREVLRARDSKEKIALLLGLGELGHAEAEGYFARILRERTAPELLAPAVRSLGRIRGTRGLPLVLEAFGREGLFAVACEALGEYGGPEATKHLLSRAGELAALKALAKLAAKEARGLFLSALQREPPWTAVAARGIAGLGDPALGERLVPLIASNDEPTARAAFEGYALLGAPKGAAPLLEAASKELRPWMIPALGGVARPEVRRYLLGLLAPSEPKGFWKKLLRWSREASRVDPKLVYRALRGVDDPETLGALAARLAVESEPASLRELLACGPLVADPRCRGPLSALWGHEDLLMQYLAARALLQAPTQTFLSEAVALLGRPGFRPFEQAPGLADASHLLDVYAKDNNPFLLLGGLLDSGFPDLPALERTLGDRFRARAFPSPMPATERFKAAVDGDTGAFLSALAAAQPASREPLERLWCVLAEVEEGAGSLLDLFLCSTGIHRGGVQRALMGGMASAVGRFLQGKGDAELVVLDAIASKIPAGAAAARELKEVFGRARRTLMAECRDMALIPDGPPRGDMVLVERL